MSNRHDILIVGAGISGLSTAWWLTRAGYDTLVITDDAQPGGTLRTIRDNGWLVDLGPNSALETTPLFRQLFADIGIADEVEYANESSNRRYIVRDGKLHALPMSFTAFLRSGLWSWKAKIRLLREPFVGRAEHEETVAEFVTRRLGQEFLDYAVNPFVAGVFAGDPATLSVRAAFPKLYALEKTYGGLIKGQILGARDRKKRGEVAKDRARMFSFKNGMQSLAESVANALGDRVRTNAAVVSITKPRESDSLNEAFTIRARSDGSELSISANAVILAIPAYKAASLIEPFDRPLALSLRNICYPPVAEVFLGFKREQLKRNLDGFGFLVPEKERRQILGTIWSSAIFPGRAPNGYVALTTFVGGSRQPELCSKDEGELISLVRRELEDIMQLRGDPAYSRVTKWDRAIPQYQIGHLSIVKSIEEFEKLHPGLFLTGNYRGGISVGDCVTNSKTVSDSVMKFVEHSRKSIAV